MEFKNQRILLIGGAGFIGLHLAKKLSSINNDITIFSKDNSKAKKLLFSKKIKFTKGDISNYKDVEKNINNKEIILNLASVVNSSQIVDFKNDLDVNCRGQINILNARKNINPHSKYIFFGTRAQFGKVEENDLPVLEDHCQKPVSLYGIHKQTAENYCKLYELTFNLKSIILRFPQIYGPSLTNENTQGIIDKFIKKAMRSELFYVNGFGKDIKDLIYIEDAVDLIIRVMESDVDGGTFNVGSGKKIKFIEIAEKIVEVCGSGSFKTVPFLKEIKKFELGNFYFDTSKVNKKFNWKPKTSLDEGIKKTKAFYKNG